MPDFTYDAVELLKNKSDVRPRTAPVEKSYTAAEWNALVAAVESLRTAILSGDYHGLVTNPSAAVSGAAGVRLRNKDGILQQSENGGAWRTLAAPGEVHVRDFGAVGDGSTDDTAALQAAFDSAVVTGKVIVLEGRKTYKTTDELRLGTGAGDYARLEGRGATISCEKAGDPCRAVLAIDNDVAIVREVMFVGNGTANSGVWLTDASTSVFERVGTYTTLVDGFTSYANNDRCSYRECTARVTGMIFHTTGYAGGSPAYIKRSVTGTVSKTSGSSCVITRDSGTVDFTTMGIRPRDFISLHATAPGDSAAEWLQIHSVDSATQITCKGHPVSSGAASGLKFSIHVGDGYHEGPGRADNNINRIDGFLAENTAGAGFSFGGLYGPRCTNLQVNASGSYPVVIASNDLQCIVSTFQGVYFELCNAADNFFLGGAAGVSIDSANVTGNPVVSSGGFNWGTVTNQQNAGDPGRIDAIETTTVNHIPVKNLIDGAQLRGKLYGRDYLAATSPGGGYLWIAENRTAAAEIMAGLEWFYDDAAAAGLVIDTDTAINNDDAALVIANANLLTKHLLKLRNAGAFKFGVGFLGDVRTLSSDSSGTPGAATIDLPSGRFALATGAASVVITNKLCKVGTKVFLSKLDNDTTAQDFKVVAADGSFTVTPAVVSTAAVKFDFFLVNIGS